MKLVKNPLFNSDTKCFKCIPAIFNLGAVGLVVSLVTLIYGAISSTMTHGSNSALFCWDLAFGTGVGFDSVEQNMFHMVCDPA